MKTTYSSGGKDILFMGNDIFNLYDEKSLEDTESTLYSCISKYKQKFQNQRNQYGNPQLEAKLVVQYLGLQDENHEESHSFDLLESDVLDKMICWLRDIQPDNSPKSYVSCPSIL